jgi:hypothetical protein
VKGPSHVTPRIKDPAMQERHLKVSTTVRFEVFTAVTMKKAVFWDVAPCSSGVDRRFRGTYRLHLQGIRESIRKSAHEASVRDVKGRRMLRVRIFLYSPLYPEDGGDTFLRNVG